MREISSLELYRLAKELKQLEGSHLRKFYETGEGSFELLFYKEGQIPVYAKLLKTINITNYLSEHEHASEFSMQMRRRLENERVEKVYQHYMDRIFIFEFSEYKLIFEMFGKGNLLLVDKNGEIVVPYKRLAYKDRKIDFHERYVLPEGKKELNKEEGFSLIKELINMKGEERLISLSKYFEYGPLYVENAIISLGLNPKDKIKDLSYDKALGLAHMLAEMKDIAEKSRPRLYIKEHDYALVRIEKYDNSAPNVKEYESLSSLLDDFYIEERKKGRDEENEKEKEAIRRSIEKQEELIKRLEEDSKRYAEIGNIIISNMNYFNNIINYAKSRKKPSIEELRQFESDSIKIDGVDLKNKKIKIRVKV